MNKTTDASNKGKIPVSAYDADADNEMDIDFALKEELKAKNLEYRFIDFKQARLNGGRSRSGWVVYKRESEDPRLAGIKSLADPDGLVRQGSMVLAVKPVVSAERQRARVREQNRTLAKYTQDVTKELGSKAQRELGGSRIIAGYEKNS